MKSFLCALVFACAMPFSAYAGVTFVSNHDELNRALEEQAQGRLESLAVQYDYLHSGTAKHQRDKIRSTVATLLATNGVAVYVYGKNLPSGALAELDIEHGDRASCELSVIQSRMKVGKTLVHGCGASSAVHDEATLREQVINHDGHLRKHFAR